PAFSSQRSVWQSVFLGVAVWRAGPRGNSFRTIAGRQRHRLMQNAAMLWTGGKDSALALHEAVLYDCRVRCLVTFAPTDPDFLAHPLAFIKLQAQALNLPHHVLSIQEPFAQGYETALAQLRDEMNIDAVITGDIAEVAGSP